MAMEELTALIHKVVSQSYFQGFQVNEEETIDILQLADDTIVLGIGSHENQWCLKFILRGFDLMSGLKVNLCKSNLYGINMGEWNLEGASTFLSCNIGKLPFKFLGVMVGDSPRRCGMWKDVISNCRRKLTAWRGRYLSLGGRVVLIN
ncbi:uncharacterized protein LOC131597980 [Vicia villosa]|uniref:uncharacterized protein LOC131597980 n=1 Tax=Vicia villosa TaxID=3911 RepID=UPI00273A8624|nr:uncharacterized protein LOC131597980 [Vicia villosa]